MTIAQLEHAPTFADPLPAQTTLDRMEELFCKRRSEAIVIRTRRMQIRDWDDRNVEPEAQAADRRKLLNNQLTQAELRHAEIEREIIEVARRIVTEADNSETLLAVLRMREQLAAERAAMEVTQ